jgi:phosphatidylinositol alpha-mannosyltransferase
VSVAAGTRRGMKIALVTPYDVAHPGGVTEHIAHLRGEFLRLGHEVIVIAPRTRRGGGVRLRDGLYEIGRTVSFPANGSMVRVTLDVTLYAAVKDLMRRERFDVVHLHEPLMPVLPYMVLLNSQSVNVATFHAARASNPWYRGFRSYMTFVLSRLDGRIAVSEPAREVVGQYFEGPYEIIPNGIKVDRFAAVEPLDWVGDSCPRILFVGRFGESRKGFKYLLRALALVQRQFPEARLVVVGTGKPDRFAGMIERLGLGGVDFAGFVSPSDLPRYYASCDVFCAPSVSRESFGIVLLEAMAAGKPVVASDIPGYAGVVTHDREGLLVPPKDATSLALALVRVLADSDLRERLGTFGRQTADSFAWPRIAARVLDVYERAERGATAAPWRRGFD